MIANAPKGINFHTMREVFGLDNEQAKRRLKDTLDKLREGGHIRYDREKQRYFATRPTSPLMVARAHITPHGIELTPIKWQQSKASKPFMMVKRTDTEYNNIRDGDRVLIAIQATQSHIRHGRKTLLTNCAVLRILQESDAPEIRATFNKSANGTGVTITPAYRMAKGLKFPVKTLAAEGPYALEDYPDKAEVLFRVEEKSSQHALSGTITDLAKWNKEYPSSLLSQRDKSARQFREHPFTEEQEFRAAQIAQNAPIPSDYEDLRGMIQFAVDPPDAKDRDDAIAARPDEAPDNKNGWIITVTDIDVARLVTQMPEALENTLAHPFSAYTNDSVIHMLPKVWAEGAASLINNEERFCVSAEIRIDASGYMLDHRIFRSLSAPRQVSYNAFDRVLVKGHEKGFSPAMAQAARNIHGAYEALVIEDTNRQALNFEQARYYAENDAQGRIAAIHSETESGSISRDIIKKFMVLASRAFRAECARIGAPTIDRVESAPNIHERLPKHISPNNKEGQFLNRVWTRDVIQRTLDLHAGDPAMSQAISDLLVRRVMRPGRFTTEEKGHFGMGFEDEPYAAFNSPVRSLDNLVNQLSLYERKGWLEDYCDAEQLEWLQENFIGPQAQIKLAEAMNEEQPQYKALQRAAMKRLAIGFLHRYEGRTISASFQHVTENDISLKLEDCARPFMLPLSAIAGASFAADVPNQQLIDQKKGRTIKAAEWMEIKLIKADPLENKLVVSIPEQQPHIEKVPFQQRTDNTHTILLRAQVVEATTKALRVRIGNKELDWSKNFPGSRSQRRGDLYHYNTGLTIVKDTEQSFKVRINPQNNTVIDVIPIPQGVMKRDKKCDAFYKAHGISFGETQRRTSKQEWMDVIRSLG